LKFIYFFHHLLWYCEMSSEIIQNLHYDNYDDFQHVDFIFSQNFISLFWGLFNDETDLRVRYGSLNIWFGNLMGFLILSINELNVILKHNPFARWQKSKVTLVYVYLHFPKCTQQTFVPPNDKSSPFLQIFLWKILNYGFTSVGFFFFNFLMLLQTWQWAIRGFSQIWLQEK
jgi:hypothetical protein